MPGPLNPAVLKAYADPSYLSSDPSPVKQPYGGPNYMRRVGIPAMAAGQGFDAGTTIANLHNPNMGEANSAMYGAHPSSGRVLGTKLAAIAPLALFLDHVYSKAPAGSTARKVALTMALAAAGVGVAAGAHNVGMAK